MKAKLPNELALAVRDFFADFLPSVRSLSPHTIASYRDSLVLLLRFVAEQQGRNVSGLNFEDLGASQMLSFLAHLESKRHNSATTRNVRLSAFHSFATRPPDIPTDLSNVSGYWPFPSSAPASAPLNIWSMKRSNWSSPLWISRRSTGGVTTLCWLSSSTPALAFRRSWTCASVICN